MKAIYKFQYSEELKNYDYIGLFDSLQKFNEMWKDKLNIKERIDVWTDIFSRENEL